MEIDKVQTQKKYLGFLKQHLMKSQNVKTNWCIKNNVLPVVPLTVFSDL